MKFLAAVSLLATTALAGMHHEPGVVQVTQTVHEVKTVIKAHGEPSPHPAPAQIYPAQNHPAPQQVHPAPVPQQVHPAPVAPVEHQQPAGAHTTPAPMKHVAEIKPGAAGPQTHTVTVGGPGDKVLLYQPEHIQANVGDIVHFIFLQQNHSVTESTFANPCVKKEGTVNDSGLLPNPNGTVIPAPTWQYTVTTTDPTWWYCKQRTGNHCGRGMVFAINPTVERSFNTFKQKAIEINGTAPAPNTALPPPSPQSTVTLDVAGPGATQTPVPSVNQPPVQVGWNQGGAAQCNCACFCGVGSFAKQDQGIGAFGGMGGSLPSPWQPVAARRRLRM